MDNHRARDTPTPRTPWNAVITRIRTQYTAIAYDLEDDFTAKTIRLRHPNGAWHPVTVSDAELRRERPRVIAQRVFENFLKSARLT